MRSMDRPVLVVDDSAFMRKLICDTLLQGGIYPVIEAKDGEEAVAKFIEKLPSLVLMDINMPKKNGIDAAREILSIDPKSEVVMLTAIDQEWAKEEAKKIGVKHFIAKPFRREELFRTINTALLMRR